MDDDLMDEIRKFFKINSDLFDVDFFIFPEMDNDNNPKKKLHEYLKNHNIDPNIKQKKLMPPPSKIDDGTIDVEELSLEPCRHSDNSCIVKPYTEIDDSE